MCQVLSSSQRKQRWTKMDVILPAVNIASSWETRIYLNNHINNILVITRMLRGSIWGHKSLLEGDLSFFNFHEQITRDLRFAGSVAMSRETRGEMSVSDRLTMCKTPVWVCLRIGWSGWNQGREGIKSAGQLWGSGAGVMYFGQWNSGQHDVSKSLTSTSVLSLVLLSHLGHIRERAHHRKTSYAEPSEVALAIPATAIQTTGNVCRPSWGQRNCPPKHSLKLPVFRLMKNECLSF